MTRKKYIKSMMAMYDISPREARELARVANQDGYSYEQAFRTAFEIYATSLIQEFLAQRAEADHESD